MKSTLFQIGIRRKFPELFQNPLYSYDMSIFVIIGKNEDNIQIYNDKDIKLLSKNLVYVPLEACWCVC